MQLRSLSLLLLAMLFGNLVPTAVVAEAWSNGANDEAEAAGSFTQDQTGKQHSAPCSPSQTRQGPRVAIIIDDMGQHRQMGVRLIEMPLHLSFSFLPGTPFVHTQASLAHERGRDVMVHMPMEPKDSRWKLGEDALYVRDTAEIIAKKTQKMLNAVPHAMGANNHMGSRFTEDGKAMQAVLEVVGKHSFFFVDSVTTPGSRGLATARELHLPSAKRQVFLDNVQDVQAICRQLDVLAAIAEKEGQAIAIGHPHQATFQALNHCGERLLKRVKLVGVGELVR